MRMAVVSDTHGKHDSTQAALDLIRPREVDLILHCGDIGEESLIELFHDWPAHFVFGNVDQNRTAFAQAIENAGQHSHGIFGELIIEEKRIAFLHGDDVSRLNQEIASENWDLICHGHTHRKQTRVEGSTVVLNPGALFRANPRTLAIVELPAITIEFLEVR